MFLYYYCLNHVGGVIDSELASSVVDCGFEPPSSRTKDYKISMFCFSAKHTSLRRNIRDWFARNQDN